MKQFVNILKRVKGVAAEWERNHNQKKKRTNKGGKGNKSSL